ncbi:MAG TPA: hypothetical protein PK542_02450 [Treponemataceae bacterium]|nr:hypothetical protein [Treponemataceae bacterium]HPS43330.1 hypothetical protein [Treponemataceae bacterium]
MYGEKKQRPNRLLARHARTALLAALLCMALPTALFALELGSPEWGYALDLPEGYQLAERNGSDRYHFSHTLYPADLQIALYGHDRFPDAATALTFVTDQFQSKGHQVSFTWRNRAAAIGQLSFSAHSGWALALELANGKGWLVMAAYTDEKRATELEPLLVSSLDAVFTDDGSYFESGPMTAFAWGKEKGITADYDDGTTKVSLPFNAIDANANQSIVDREFSLLTSYLNTPYVYDAWKRYYRLIWRDAWARFAKPAFILENRLPSDPAELTAKLLAWTQAFTYERNFQGSDFINLPEAFASRTGDCDSRALLLVLLLNEMGVDAVLLVSPEYSHALAAVDCPGPGARFETGGKKYLIADTTAKTKAGLIAADMADPSKWFAVDFYAFPRVQAAKTN